jgi:steroid 5-alpha reductase family enzyme
LFVLACVMTLVVYVLWLGNDHLSYIDKIWGLTPVVAGLAFILQNSVCSLGFSNTFIFCKVLIMAVWGLRLTYNFARKGGMSMEEDYRWNYVRKMFPQRIVYHIFVFGFVCFYQSLLLWTLIAPLTVRKVQPFDAQDIILSGLMLFFIATEAIADQQQWDFHELKKLAAKDKSKAELDQDVKRGFLTKGLWKLCRHPNFFSELAIWFCMYFFSVGPETGLINWTIVPWLFLLSIFIGSTPFTEKITRSKYPEYDQHIASSWALIPDLRKLF